MSEGTVYTLIAALIGGAAGGFLPLIIGHFNVENRKRYLAIQIVYLLEQYTINCCNLIATNDLSLVSMGSAGKELTEVPQLNTLPDSNDYRFLDTAIVERIFEFPQYQQLCQSEAFDLIGISDDPHVAMEVMVDSTKDCGLKAFKLAKDIRQKYKLEERKLTHGQWDMLNTLQTEVTKGPTKQAFQPSIYYAVKGEEYE